MALGVILARLQPIHNGHLELIRQALHENDSVLLLVGSADKVNERNPIPISLRLEYARAAVNEVFGVDGERVNIVPLDDLSDETNNTHDWGFYLFAHIASIGKTTEFTMYYSDGFEIIMQWFPRFVTRKFISFKLNARGSIHNNLSATEVRKMILLGDMDGLSKAVPSCVLENATFIKHLIQVSHT